MTAASWTGRTGGRSGAFVRPFRSGGTAFRASQVVGGISSSATSHPKFADQPDPPVHLGARQALLDVGRLAGAQGLRAKQAGLQVAISEPEDPEGELDHPYLIGQTAVLDVVFFCMGQVADGRLVDGDVGRIRDVASNLIPQAIGLVATDQFLIPGLALSGVPYNPSSGRVR